VTRFLLDANVVITVLKARATPLAEKVYSYPLDEIAISSIVTFELFFGAFKSAQPEHNLVLLEASRFPILGFDANDARHAGQIRASLAAAGTPIGPYDVLIAGQALARDLTLITNNVREFRRVRGLNVEDWLEPA
jgi:tRNA(fMet)-specific endonuclease VapC